YAGSLNGLDQHSAGGGAVALPQLPAVAEFEGGEEQGAAGDAQAVDLREGSAAMAQAGDMEGTGRGAIRDPEGGAGAVLGPRHEDPAVGRHHLPRVNEGREERHRDRPPGSAVGLPQLLRLARWIGGDVEESAAEGWAAHGRKAAAAA